MASTNPGAQMWTCASFPGGALTARTSSTLTSTRSSCTRPTAASSSSSGERLRGRGGAWLSWHVGTARSPDMQASGKPATAPPLPQPVAVPPLTVPRPTPAGPVLLQAKRQCREAVPLPLGAASGGLQERPGQPACVHHGRRRHDLQQPERPARGGWGRSCVCACVTGVGERLALHSIWSGALQSLCWPACRPLPSALARPHPIPAGPRSLASARAHAAWPYLPGPSSICMLMTGVTTHPPAFPPAHAACVLGTVAAAAQDAHEPCKPPMP